MLETKNLTKIYKPKKGVPVKAIDGVSLKFPDKGMIFLLGKSGSGKSTLLNLLGGLDKYDDGEIIIKGVSSKSFSQKHFDSYRNTYLGFIFQEYNILEEFTVGANIALALELQNKKATDEAINDILKEVDLEGYGSRKPNELSGGQKQRVAIARALVKSPKIIMADEPTGALDSNTGKQVFDTLKKLSKSKLVIVVSHDRDFASKYADRIIELADGKVLSDTSLCEESYEANDAVGIEFEGNTARIPEGYHLTEEDRIAINEYIDKLKNGLNLDITAKKSGEIKFVPTKQEDIKSEDNSPFKLIKSKLSLKNAFKIGGSGLKYKKFRLVMTVILSCVAFILFGLSDTFGAYNHINTATNSIYDSKINYVSLEKSVKRGEGIDTYWSSNNNKITAKEVENLKKETGIDLAGVWMPLSEDLSFGQQVDDKVQLTEGEFEIYKKSFSGVVEMDENTLSKMGHKLTAGRLPMGDKNEIAISKFISETFVKAGYWDLKTYDKKTGKNVFEKINSCADMVGKKISLMGKEYTITGIVDTFLDMERYEPLTKTLEENDSADSLINFVLYSEFTYETDRNYTGMLMVGKGGIASLISKQIKGAPTSNVYVSVFAGERYLSPMVVTKLSNVSAKDIKWIDGAKTQLNDNEIIVSADMLYEYISYEYDEKGEHQIVDTKTLSETKYNMEIFGDDHIEKSDIRVVGYIENSVEDTKVNGLAIMSDKIYDGVFKVYEGEYIGVIGAMPTERQDIKNLVTYCYNEDSGVKYQFQNPVSYELDSIDEMLEMLTKVFLYIGLGFAIFASVMLANFIATSISHKKQEIGILRAIGSRSNDVFRIFFAESFIIAMINFVISAIGVFIATTIINSALRAEVGILITILNFSVRQVALLLVVSIAVAFIASFLPVKKIASKRPIDAIRNR
ncbi:MAG: ATP-binding cassette domain-containing protein [Acutalibacteraceae bacterium]|nr:ATP-binding cassette domain-containing protein [Acutalibacteraceae bacterium]